MCKWIFWAYVISRFHQSSRETLTPGVSDFIFKTLKYVKDAQKRGGPENPTISLSVLVAGSLPTMLRCRNNVASKQIQEILLWGKVGTWCTRPSRPSGKKIVPAPISLMLTNIKRWWTMFGSLPQRYVVHFQSPYWRWYILHHKEHLRESATQWAF